MKNGEVVQVRHIAAPCHAQATTLCVGATSSEVCADLVGTTVAAANSTPDAISSDARPCGFDS